jgi:LacI family transcriptional regulator
LKDVARLAGVHPGTVSRALRDDTSHLVNEDTRTSVRRAAELLGYQINPIARSLRTSRTDTIGVLVPDINNPLFPPIVRGIQDCLEAAGYTPLVANTENDPARERRILETMLARRIDGLITATATEDSVGMSALEDVDLPVVFANRRSPQERHSSVTVDDVGGIALAVRHLADLGHQRIAHLAGPRNVSTGVARREGFLDAMNDLGLPVGQGQIAVADLFSEGCGRDACRELLAVESTALPTAIVAANDLLALGAYDALAEAGLHCPADVSVIGFNDMHFSDRFNPPLTTIRNPQNEIGRRAGQILLDEVNKASAPGARHEVLDVELVVRGSTAKPRS